MILRDFARSLNSVSSAKCLSANWLLVPWEKCRRTKNWLVESQHWPMAIPSLLRRFP